MPDVRTEEIRARHAAATPGPWGTSRDLNGTYTVKHGTYVTREDGFGSDGDVASLVGDEQTAYRNGSFIAHARDDVPYLLGRVAELELGADVVSPGQWATIRGLVDWIDQANGRAPHEVAMRILKVTEEAGEAASAYIGMTGQNPRKGVTHTREDVADELCDVILAAAVALASVVDDAEGVLAGKLAKVAARAAQAEASA